MTDEQWNILSLQFDREVVLCDDKRGSYLIPLFIDHILLDSCSQDVRDALEKALRKTFNQTVR